MLVHLQNNLELEALIDQVRNTANLIDVPVIIMQLYVGNRPVFGPSSNLELHESPEIILLYNPYD